MNITRPRRESVAKRLIDQRGARRPGVGCSARRPRDRGRLQLFLAEQLNIEESFRSTTTRFGAVHLIDALDDRVARGKVEFDVSSRGEGERVLALDIERISSGDGDASIGNGQR